MTTDQNHDIKAGAAPKAQAKKAKPVKAAKRKVPTRDIKARDSQAPAPGPFALAMACASMQEEPIPHSYVRAIVTVDGGVLILNGDQLIHELEQDAARAVWGLA